MNDYSFPPHILFAALDSTPIGATITDPAGRIEWVNPAFLRLTGYRLADLIGQNISVLKSGEHADEEYREIWQTISSGLTWRGTLINKRKDGTLYNESQTITPITGEDGTIQYYVAFKEDISAMIALEKQKKNDLERIQSNSRELHALNKLFQDNLHARSDLHDGVRSTIPTLSGLAAELSQVATSLEATWRRDAAVS
ncbi:MAG: PAS domain S-box protein [Chloroflexi bacterium]|nr:PAS domain S-box protein [Chloroflexota bacterium]MDA1174800.1 PAS domain S-box protein [Chloroflexota bacterium]